MLAGGNFSLPATSSQAYWEVRPPKENNREGKVPAETCHLSAQKSNRNSEVSCDVTLDAAQMVE